MKLQTIFFLILNLTLVHFTIIAQEIHSPRHPDFNGLSHSSDIFKITPDTILKPGKTRLQSNFFYFKLEQLESLIFSQEIEYALSKLFSIQIVFPVILKLQPKNQKNKTGFGKLRLVSDIRWFLEQNFGAILRLGIDLPTTNIKRSTIVGYNEPAFLIEHETIFLSREWFIDYTLSTLVPMTHGKTYQGIRFGHFLDFTRQYYFGKEKDINVILGVVFNSSYSGKNKLDDIIDPNSGRFVLELGPLFSISKNDMLFDIRIPIPVTERIFGVQQSLKYTIATSFQIIF